MPWRLRCRDGAQLKIIKGGSGAWCLVGGGRIVNCQCCRRPSCDTVTQFYGPSGDDTAMTEEVKETFQRIQSSGGVRGVAIITKDGIPLQTTLDDDTTVQVRIH